MQKTRTQVLSVQYRIVVRLGWGRIYISDVIIHSHRSPATDPGLYFLAYTTTTRYILSLTVHLMTALISSSLRVTEVDGCLCCGDEH